MTTELRDLSQYQLDLSRRWEDRVRLIFCVYEGAGQITIEETGQKFPIISINLNDTIDYIRSISQSYSTIMVNYEGSSLKRTIQNLTSIHDIDWSHVPDLNQPLLFSQTLDTLKKCVKASSNQRSSSVYETQLNNTNLGSFIKELIQNHQPDLQVTRYAQITDTPTDMVFQVVIDGQLLTIQDGNISYNIYWQYDIDEGYYHLQGLEIPDGLKYPMTQNLNDSNHSNDHLNDQSH